MVLTLSIADRLAVADLETYLARARRLEDGSVRIIAQSNVVAVYSAIVYPRGLLDQSPTVLGLRTFELAEPADFDTVVPVRSLLERTSTAVEGSEPGDFPITVTLPHEVVTVTWAGISPPRGGWVRHDEVDSRVFEKVAVEGIEEVAASVPEGAGELIVQRVRSEVWGRPIVGVEHVPAGAAFAVFGLRFLGRDEPVTIYETGPWTRLTTQRGHVLMRRKPWTLRR